MLLLSIPFDRCQSYVYVDVIVLKGKLRPGNKTLLTILTNYLSKISIRLNYRCTI